MAEKKRALWAPVDFLLFGVLITVVAGIVGGLIVVIGPDWVGYAVMGAFGFLGQSWFIIGMIAKGVQVGRRSA